ncbi:MAG TPA: MGMT family protein [Candidatus Omnitrophota bacterium]|nr:MGMT family protein [Candidatus Omnitrophota bacterium]
MRLSVKKEPKLTAFQWKVLKATMEIPLGQTRSYKWVAQRIGKPTALRAVGQALRRNPYPVIIPCHRVIREDGSLAGYAGGSSKRKAELLEREQKILNQLK